MLVFTFKTITHLQIKNVKTREVVVNCYGSQHACFCFKHVVIYIINSSFTVIMVYLSCIQHSFNLIVSKRKVLNKEF